MSANLTSTIVAFVLGATFATFLLVGPLSRVGNEMRRGAGKPELSDRTVRYRMLPVVLFACAVGSVVGYFLMESGRFD